MLDPKTGDKEQNLSPGMAMELILKEKDKGRLNFVKFSDGQILKMMERAGILQQLEEKERLGVSATLVPAISGG